MSDVMTNNPMAPAVRPSFEFKPQELEAFRDTGYELIPLNAPDALDQRGRSIGKAPMRGWRKDRALTVDEALQHMQEGSNVGVRLRATDLVVDVDPRNFEEGDDPIARLQKDLDIRLDDWPHVITGSGGDHFYMTIPEGFLASDTVESYPGIEFKSHGRQMVAPGSSHPDTGKAYLWDDLAEPVRSAAAAPAALLDLIRRPERTSTVEAGEYSAEQIETLLDGLDPTAYSDQSKWLELMMACHHGSAGDAREEFIAWSVSDPAYSGDEHLIGRRWDSLHADGSAKRVTIKTLFKALVGVGRDDLIDKVTRGDPADDFPDDLDDLPDFIRAAAAPKDTLLDRINASRFTVLTGGKYLVGREWFDERMQRHVVDWNPDEAARKHMNIKSVETPEGKQVPLGDWWLKHPKRRQYDWVVFDPTPGASKPEVYNLWRGWAIEPREGDWSLLKRLLRDVLCRGDQASYDYVLRWSAFMVQHPNTPAEVALVFKGPKGVGKGTFGRELKALAGQHGRQVAQPEHFTGRFNEHLADTILLFVDEGLWAGDKKVEGALKNLITEPTLTFEGKNKPIIEGPNHLHVVIASNNDWVIPATPDERRFGVFEADPDAKAALPSGFFRDLNDQMRDGGRAAMLHDLLAMDLGDWHPRKDIPQTAALAAQKVEGFRSDPIAFWWYRCLEDGKCGGMEGPGLWPKAFDVDSLSKEDMLLDLNQQAWAMSKRAEFTKTKLARFLAQVGVDVKARNKQGGKVWHVPALDDARKAFSAWVGGSLEWDD